MLACGTGNTELARMLLLEGNADINIQTKVSEYMRYDYVIVLMLL